MVPRLRNEMTTQTLQRSREPILVRESERERVLTIFVVRLLVQVDVGLHVPDELVGQQLGGLGGPQDVLPHVAHLGTHRPEGGLRGGGQTWGLG